MSQPSTITGELTSQFINLMLEEDDVAFVDKTGLRVMCKVCQRYIPMSLPPPGNDGSKPGSVDMRRTWKVDWSMHRQNHSMMSGLDSSSAAVSITASPQSSSSTIHSHSHSYPHSGSQSSRRRPQTANSCSMSFPHPSNRSRAKYSPLTLNTRIEDRGVQGQMQNSPISARYPHTPSNHGVQLIRSPTSISNNSPKTHLGYPPSSYASSGNSYSQRKKSSSPTIRSHPNPLGLPPVSAQPTQNYQHSPLNTNHMDISSHQQLPSSSAYSARKRQSLPPLPRSATSNPMSLSNLLNDDRASKPQPPALGSSATPIEIDDSDDSTDKRKRSTSHSFFICFCNREPKVCEQSDIRSKRKSITKGRRETQKFKFKTSLGYRIENNEDEGDLDSAITLGKKRRRRSRNKESCLGGFREKVGRFVIPPQEQNSHAVNNIETNSTSSDDSSFLPITPGLARKALENGVEGKFKFGVPIIRVVDVDVDVDQHQESKISWNGNLGDREDYCERTRHFDDTKFVNSDKMEEEMSVGMGWSLDSRNFVLRPASFDELVYDSSDDYPGSFRRHWEKPADNRDGRKNFNEIKDDDIMGGLGKRRDYYGDGFDSARPWQRRPTPPRSAVCLRNHKALFWNSSIQQRSVESRSRMKRTCNWVPPPWTDLPSYRHQSCYNTSSSAYGRGG